MFRWTRETHGFDGIRETGGRYKLYYWFEAWGREDQSNWIQRSVVHRPPTPRELATADYIVFGFRRAGREFYRTRAQGLDIKKRDEKKKRTPAKKTRARRK